MLRDMQVESSPSGSASVTLSYHKAWLPMVYVGCRGAFLLLDPEAPGIRLGWKVENTVEVSP